MSISRKTGTAVTPIDRRSGKDRRKLEKGPPGTHDRRRSVEPRKPEVVELDLSPSEWGALTGADELKR
jgi:hypothetical protein